MYKTKAEQEEVPVAQPEPPKKDEKNTQSQKNSRFQKRGPDFDDPFDPMNATKNYKLKNEEAEEEAKNELPTTISQAPAAEARPLPIAAPSQPQRFLPAALRKKLAAAPSAPSSTIAP